MMNIKKTFLLFIMATPIMVLAQDLQMVTQNGNTTTLGINTDGPSTIFGLNFSLANPYTKQIVPRGFNFWLSNGAEDGRLLMPYNNTVSARFQNLGLVIDKSVGIGTNAPSYPLDVVRYISAGAQGGLDIAVLGGGAGVGAMLKLYYANGVENTRLMGNNDSWLNAYVGNVGIGTINPQDKLTVAGTIGAREIKVSTNAGADFVFEPGYKLTDLTELEKFVKTNKHLPEIPTAKQMVENGVNLGELNIKLLQKVEELTLHLIEKDKELKNDASLIKGQQDQIDELKKGYAELKEYLLEKQKTKK